MKKNSPALFSADGHPILVPMLRQVNHAIELKQKEFMKPYHITFQQFMVLHHVFLLGAQAPVNQKSLLKHMKITSPSVSNLIRQLVEKGYLERTKSTRDARNDHLALTPQGEGLYQTVRKVSLRFNQQIIDGFTPEELSVFFRSLKKIGVNLEACLNDEPQTMEDTL